MDYYKNAVMYILLRESGSVPKQILLQAEESDYELLLSEYLDVNSEDELKEYIEQFL